MPTWATKVPGYYRTHPWLTSVTSPPTPWTWAPYSIPVPHGFLRTIWFPYPNRRSFQLRSSLRSALRLRLVFRQFCSTTSTATGSNHSLPLVQTIGFPHAHLCTPFPFAVTDVPASVLAYHPVFVPNCLWLGRDDAGGSNRVCRHLLVSVSRVGRQKVRNLRRAMSQLRWPMSMWRHSNLVLHRRTPSPFDLVVIQPTLLHLVIPPWAIQLGNVGHSRFLNPPQFQHIRPPIQWFCRRFLAFCALPCASALSMLLRNVRRSDPLPCFLSCAPSRPFSALFLGPRTRQFVLRGAYIPGYH